MVVRVKRGGRVVVCGRERGVGVVVCGRERDGEVEGTGWWSGCVWEGAG